ncbi:MAG: hypothetical protein PHO66_06220, partial [Eubacteriales bacterium]|nr:hypothetical protein [Eubacteriales bacterium]
MPLFYSTFAAGMEEAVQRFIPQDMPGSSIERMLPGAVHYRRKALPKHIPSWLNNTFLSLMTFSKATKAPLQEMVRIADTRGLDAETLVAHLPADAATFRVLFMLDGAVAHVGEKSLERAETLLGIFSGLQVDRAKPDVEFWFIYRPEGCGFLLMRLTSHKRSKNLVSGELRADIASFLCRLTGPLPGQVMLNAYAAYGSVVSAGLEYPYEKIVACESEPKLVQALSSRFSACPQVSPLLTAHPELTDVPSGSVDRMIAQPVPELTG